MSKEESKQSDFAGIKKIKYGNDECATNIYKQIGFDENGKPFIFNDEGKKIFFTVANGERIEEIENGDTIVREYADLCGNIRTFIYNKEQYNNKLIFEATKTSKPYYDCCSENEVIGSSDYIVLSTINLISCIKKVNRVWEYDSSKNKLSFDNEEYDYEIDVRHLRGPYDTIDFIRQESDSDDDYDDKKDNKQYKYNQIDFYKWLCEYKKNISKCINNCKQSDMKIFKQKGNIDYNYIDKLIDEQENTCWKCHDALTVFEYVPYCSYKFSIDRIDNNKPHDKDNVRMSCYFCNCVNHAKYDKNTKLKCEDKTCFCNHRLFDKYNMDLYKEDLKRHYKEKRNFLYNLKE
jgi:hypothetical protein